MPVSGKPVYCVRVEAFFEAAHHLRSYNGKPEPLHGHSFRVEVDVETATLNPEGMAVDFVMFREVVNGFIRRLDHTYLNEVSPFTDIAPTAENLARWLFEGIQPASGQNGVRLVEVRVFEGREGSAAYRLSPRAEVNR